MPSSCRRGRTPSPFPVVVALVAALIAARPSLAAAPAPAKKDSSARTKPKDVELTPSVSPAEARPGDTVVYKVTARLKPGWHIYTYAKDQQGEGPRNTRFDLFDPGGLAVAGDWTASREPVRKKETVFPNLDSVSFFEDEVSWTIPLKVPADATPGKKTIRCQASYQICDARSCSFPGYWTLPDAALTVVGGEATPAQAFGPERKPKNVALSASVKPNEAKAGATVTYSVTAKLDPGWHIYDYAREAPASGPPVTQFSFPDTGGLTVAGDWTPDKAPQVKQDEGFNALVSTFEGEVTWSLPLKVPTDLAPGQKTIQGQIAYQVCDATSCLPPFRTSLPAAHLTVLPGGSTVATPAEAPRAAATPTPTAKADKVRAVTEVEEKAREGIIPLMIASAIGGLFALLMPCVWPMVPITVNFFVKQGQAKNGSPTALAVTYCLAIVGLFTAIGVFCSFFVSATALPRLANSPWLNFAVAGLFLAFGLSLLGFFEIRLPNALVNASAKGESRGGLIGVVFMAMTLTITSFTCTFPVVGGLLVMAASGQFFYPIIGLATFATVLALPFFLLALSPGLLAKVPKGGDWMNAVKVVGGLVEVGAAFKFLNTAEIAFVTPENAWIDAQFVLTTWVVLAAVCGFYLLGFFRTNHDYSEVQVGPGRMILGASFLGIALFLAPALFGRPPKSQVWDRLVLGLLPPDANTDFQAEGPTMLASSDGKPRVEKATDTDPEKAERQEKTFHGVTWGLSYDQAVERSKAEKKPILIDFTGVNCSNCRLMEGQVFPRPEVAALLDRFVRVQLYTDYVPIASITADQRLELARKNQERQIDLTSEPTNPFYVVISPDGKRLGRLGGYNPPETFLDFLTKALDKLKGNDGGKVAQAEGTR